MKTLYNLFISFTLLVTAACVSQQPAQTGLKMSALTLMESHEEFFVNYTNYQTTAEQLEMLKGISQPITITALFGTWCHDSEREVPRLIKLIEQANNPNITLDLIALNYKKQAEARFALKYTPTFVISVSGQEVGRIVERPVVSLAQDIIDAL